MRSGHTTRQRYAMLALAAMLTTSLVIAPIWNEPAAHAQDGFDEDDGFEAGERYYDQATRYARYKAYSRALKFFKKALPFMNEESNIYFNLASVCAALTNHEETYFYGTAFLRLDPDSLYSKDVLVMVKRAGSTLRARRRAPAMVRFDIEPKGTALYVNDVPVGASGGPPISFPAGLYTVRGQVDDYHPFKRTFTVNPRTPVKVRGAFEKIKYYGHLQVQTFEAPCTWPCTALQAAVDRDDKSGAGLTEAKGVRVFLNDSQIGESPMEKVKLLSDRYLVRFEKGGFDTWSRYVTIMRNDTYVLQPILERATPAETPKK